jgi:hypothetical protein
MLDVAEISKSFLGVLYGPWARKTSWSLKQALPTTSKPARLPT